jgi:hypothetical protein
MAVAAVVAVKHLSSKLAAKEKVAADPLFD